MFLRQKRLTSLAPRKSAAKFLFPLLLLFMFAPTTQAKKGEAGFLDRTLAIHGRLYKYQVFIPDDWTPAKKWPVILFLHGAGERGDDGLAQTQVGIGAAVRLHRSWFPAVIVMPQCLPDRRWIEPVMASLALAALAAAAREFHGDANRTYLTGLSMGGYGTWYLAAQHPGMFAAIVPISGGIALPPRFLQEHPELAKVSLPDDPKSYSDIAAKIGKTPVWIFHGSDDPTIPVTESRRMNEALKAAGGDVKYTEYPGVNHNSWDKAYAEADLLPWLLSKTTSGVSAK